MAVFTGLGSAASPSITFSSDTDTGIFSPGANQLAVATNGAQRVSIDSSGRLLVGISTSVSQNIANGTVTPQLQNASTNQSGSTISSVNYNSGGNPAILALGSSTGGTLATQGVVNNDGKLGHIVFTGSDGTTFLTAAEITAEVDGTPGTDDMPGRLVFRTTADGSASPTERLRIDSSGRLLVGTSTALTNTYVSGTAIAPVAQIEGNSGSACALSITRQTGAAANIILQRGVTGTPVAINHAVGQVNFNGFDGTNFRPAAQITAEVDGTPGTNDMPGRLVFSTTADGASSPTERMRISSDGVTLFAGRVAFPGTNAITALSEAKSIFLHSNSGSTGGPVAFESQAVDTSTRYHAVYGNGNGIVGAITTNGSATSFVTSSDYRLKENVVPLDGGITRLLQLKPSRFNFIADPDTVVDGFIAHETAAVVPECITGTKDEMEAIGTLTEWNGKVIGTDVLEPEDLAWEDQVEVTPAVEATYDEEGNELTPAADAVYETVTRTRTWEQTGERPVYQGIDQSKIVPLLTAALQEAIERIELLEAEVTALKA